MSSYSSKIRTLATNLEYNDVIKFDPQNIKVIKYEHFPSKSVYDARVFIYNTLIKALDKHYKGATISYLLNARCPTCPSNVPLMLEFEVVVNDSKYPQNYNDLKESKECYFDFMNFIQTLKNNNIGVYFND